MFIITETNNEILNLAHYRGIQINRAGGKYRLDAYVNKTGGFPGIDLEVIAVFADEKQALNAIYDLGLAIKNGKSLWDVNDYKKRVNI